MRTPTFTFAAAWLCGTLIAPAASTEPSDPRLKEVWYDPQAVVSVLVKRGVVTDIVLDAGESITDVASGLGGDCRQPDASWCIAAQPGGRHIFVKPKSTAGAANNLAVVTDRRTHSFRLEVLAEGDSRSPIYRLSVKTATPRPTAAVAQERLVAPALLPSEAIPASPAEIIAARLSAAPTVVNTNYSIAEGADSQNIVPSLVFDDCRFTYLRFANNRELPAVFDVRADGSEALVNVRMEGDLLVVDRISPRLTLRAGSAVVGLWNEAFEPDGVAPKDGTTVSGVARSLKNLDAPSSHGARP